MNPHHERLFYRNNVDKIGVIFYQKMQTSLERCLLFVIVLLPEPVQDLRLCLRRECACRYVGFDSLRIDGSRLDSVIHVRLYPRPYYRQTFVENIQVRAVDDAFISVLRRHYLMPVDIYGDLLL